MTYATDYTTLLSGRYWSGAEVTHQPVFVTYSFNAAAPPSDAGRLSPSALATFTAFTAAQQDEARQALTAWSSASGVAGGGSGIIFLEVAPGQGDINFSGYNFSSDSNAQGAGGMGYYPWGDWNYSTFSGNAGHFASDLPGPGAVLMNTAFETGGVFSYATVLHEIGHALGLKHPTEAWSDEVPGWIDVEHAQWDPAVAYSSSFSIMSEGATTLTAPTAADYQAIQSVYGTSTQAAQQLISWSWDPLTYTLTQTLKPGGQTVRGVGVNNVINGGSGDDVIYAMGSGHNLVYGGAGADNLVGGHGVNILDGGAGADTLNGWFGPSVASYADAHAAVTANLAAPWLNTGDAAGDVYLQIHDLTGSAYNDALTGDDSDNVLQGGAGNDLLDGGAGSDTASYADAVGGVTVDLGKTTGQWTTSAGTDTLTNIENVIGSAYNDTIKGDAGDNVLDGGAGVDTLSYLGAAAKVTVSLAVTAPQATGGAGTDTVLHFENLTGSAFNDVLEGNLGDNVIDGGDGVDTLIFSHQGKAVTVNLSITGPQNTGAGMDTIKHIENLTGTGLSDTLIGDGHDNVIKGGSGNDKITGGGGHDVLWGNNGADTFIFVASTDSPNSTARDQIADFSHAQGDLIDLRGIDANTTLAGDQAFTFLSGSSFTGHAGDLYVRVDGSTGYRVYGDVDGDSKADFSLIVTTHDLLTFHDFLL